MTAHYRKLNDRTQNSSKYHKKDGTEVRAKLKEETKKEELEAMTERPAGIEQIAEIIEPELWGSPWGYPEHLYIESAADLEFHRNIARTKAAKIFSVIFVTGVGS